jgi:hypothetical protein
MKTDYDIFGEYNGWRIASYGAKKLRWFLHRDTNDPATMYARTKTGRMRKFTSAEAAKKAALKGA